MNECGFCHKEFDASMSDIMMRKLIDVSKLHSFGRMHKVEIEDGVDKLFLWYKNILNRKEIEIT